LLLAAGRGSRLAPLTDRTHKALLPVGDRPALSFIVDRILERGVSDVVCVTGYKDAEVREFLDRIYGGTVRTVHNERYMEDVNILSVELGVNALRRPELGYLIVETDILMEDAGWEQVLRVPAGERSFWVTRGRYAPELTGGALRTDPSGRVAEIVYAPEFETRYAGWQKLLGILYVGADEVANDRALRRRAIARTVAQYYMMPWIESLSDLPCRARDLGDVYASSYNDVAAFDSAVASFERIRGRCHG
jgi:choline kinase